MPAVIIIFFLRKKPVKTSLTKNPIVNTLKSSGRFLPFTLTTTPMNDSSQSSQDHYNTLSQDTLKATSWGFASRDSSTGGFF